MFGEMFALPLEKVGMRLACLPMIALMALAAPAFAGTEDSSTPNPFTAPSAGQTTTSGLADGTDTAQSQGAAPGQGDEFKELQPSRGDKSDSPGGFYQGQNKDADGH